MLKTLLTAFRRKLKRPAVAVHIARCRVCLGTRVACGSRSTLYVCNKLVIETRRGRRVPFEICGCFRRTRLPYNYVPSNQTYMAAIHQRYRTTDGWFVNIDMQTTYGGNIALRTKCVAR